MFALLVALHDVFMPLPDVAYGALYGIAFFALIQLAWRSTHVRNQRTLRPGMVVLVDQRSAAALSGRMRVSIESRDNSTDTEVLELPGALDNDTLFDTLPELSGRAADERQPDAGAVGDGGDGDGGGDGGGRRFLLNAMDMAPSVLSAAFQQPAAPRPAPAAVDNPPPPLPPPSSSSVDSVDTQNCCNENCENARTRGAAATPSTSSSSTSSSSTSSSSSSSPEPTTSSAEPADETAFTVKLKYLNEEMKIASGRPSEPIGEFTKRNFVAEYAANKSVRLIFNGHVLRPETRSLRDCGLFRDCVVHCLVRAAAPPPTGADDAPDSATNPAAGAGDRPTRGAANINRSTNTDGNSAAPVEDHVANYLRYISIISAVAAFAVSLAWYARFHYGHLFTMASTVGLSLTTGMLGCIWLVLRRLHQRADVLQSADQRLAAAAAVARRRRLEAEARREVAEMAGLMMNGG